METKTDVVNPANEAPVGKAAPERRRIPMSVPQRKLEVPPIPGYHLYWFRESNILRAVQAGYEFVDTDEVNLNQTAIGNDSQISGNADLGSKVRIYGGLDEQNRASYLTLMKIKEEWFREDQKLIQKQNAETMGAIFNKEAIAGSEAVSGPDRDQRYVKTALFDRPKRK